FKSVLPQSRYRLHRTAKDKAESGWDGWLVRWVFMNFADCWRSRNTKKVELEPAIGAARGRTARNAWGYERQTPSRKCCPEVGSHGGPSFGDQIDGYLILFRSLPSMSPHKKTKF